MQRTNGRWRGGGYGWRTPAATAVLAGLLGACGSCQSSGGPGAPVPAMEHPLVARIPVPDGFRLVPDRSTKWESGELRHANCEYVGKQDLVTINRFYRENMPAAGFTLRQERFDRGEYIMEFDSPAERSTIRFKRDKLKTRLIVDVSPTPKGSADRDSKPPPRRPPAAESR